MNQSDITDEKASVKRMEQLLHRAEQQGVRPLSFDELLGDAEAGDSGKEDVDEFTALRREWREAERARSHK
jgi:hypothetical protein